MDEKHRGEEFSHSVKGTTRFQLKERVLPGADPLIGIFSWLQAQLKIQEW